ncbi:Actin-like protein 7B [Saguinus oedipus]|uniref:Actin-like protein 7B n=1 Tax=Saguinus oedipus TaxID=9490 RepID=A0ABQ9TBP4_SAGOE|nr:Actin-like protein 7B [Saguinus oedipus]
MTGLSQIVQVEFEMFIWYNIQLSRGIYKPTGRSHPDFALMNPLWVIIRHFLKDEVPEAADAGDTRKETLVGHELLSTEAPLKLVNPLKHGVVVDWDLHLPHCHEDRPRGARCAGLGQSPQPQQQPEKYAELMVEAFSIPAMHVTSQSLLSIYLYGKTSGLVVESGHGVSHMLPGLTSRADYAGDDLTNYLMQLLNEAGHAFTDDHLHIIGHIKKKCCYEALLPEQELALVPEDLLVDYELPDSKLINQPGAFLLL